MTNPAAAFTYGIAPVPAPAPPVAIDTAGDGFGPEPADALSSPSAGSAGPAESTAPGAGSDVPGAGVRSPGLDHVLAAIAAADAGQPVRVTFIAPTGVTVVNRRVLEYGDEIVLTRDAIESTRDRLGGLDAAERMLASPGEQIEAHGVVEWLPGSLPPGKLRCRPGSNAWRVMRARFYESARMLPDPDRRRAALAECARVFGPDGTNDDRQAPPLYGALVTVLGADGIKRQVLDPAAGDEPDLRLFGGMIATADAPEPATAPRPPMQPVRR